MRKNHCETSISQHNTAGNKLDKNMGIKYSFILLHLRDTMCNTDFTRRKHIRP